jgi:hypothetical protein
VVNERREYVVSRVRTQGRPQLFVEELLITIRYDIGEDPLEAARNSISEHLEIAGDAFDVRMSDREGLISLSTSPPFGWGRADGLYEAIGRVAVESALFDELLDSIIGEIVDDRFAFFWEGQATEALGDLCKKAVYSADPFAKRWGQEHHDRINQLLTEANYLRQIRNIVVHGIWSVHNSEEGETRHRPWGNAKSEETVLFARLSKLRGRVVEYAMTVSDILELADKYDTLSLDLARAFYDMESPHRKDPSRFMLRWVPRMTAVEE